MVREPKNLIGSQVARVRAAGAMSQEQFAAHCQRHGWDISRETLAKIEAGIRCVSDVELLHIAKVLKTPVQELFPANKRYLFKERLK